MTDNDGKDYEVGYGKPPESGRWKAGQSGNPKGRKKGSKSEKSALRDLMEEKLPGGQGLTTREALLKTLRKRALVDNDPRAIKYLLDLDSKYLPGAYKYGTEKALLKKIVELEAQLEAEKQKSRGGVLVVPSGISMDEYIKEAEEQRQVMLLHQAQNANKM